jgi:PTS system lactose-specific IIC component
LTIISPLFSKYLTFFIIFYHFVYIIKVRDYRAKGENYMSDVNAKSSTKPTVNQPKEHKVQAWVEKRVVPVLKVISANKYLRSLMEGFYAILPIIIFSSIDGIIMWVPPAFANNPEIYPLTVRQVLNTLYVFTMSFSGLWFTMAIAYQFADKLNAKMPFGRKMNLLMVSFAAGSAYIFLSLGYAWAIKDNGTATENVGSAMIGNMGPTGMLTSIIVGLTLPWVFWLPVRFNVTIKLPKAVPQGVSQSFADIIPYGLACMTYWGFGWIFLGTMQKTFTEALFAIIQPVFNGLDSYGFFAAIAFLTAFIWFIGVHGPSVTRSFLTSFMYTNLANNQALFAQGLHPHWALTYEFSYDFTSTVGGTGATFVIPILFILLCKSKRGKAVGIASYIPIWFQVNEPALFGAPMILNPIFFIPFVILPIVNIIIYKLFISSFGMNGAIADVPWSMPAPVGLVVGSGGDYLTLLMWVIMVAIDFFAYIPFVLIYDKVTCNEEIAQAIENGEEAPLHYSYFTLMYLRLTSWMNASKTKRSEAKEKLDLIHSDIKKAKAENKARKAEEKAMEAEETKRIKEEKIAAKAAKKAGASNDSTKGAAKATTPKAVESGKEFNILVVCIGAGSSAMFANSARKGFIAAGIKNVKVDSASFGAHQDKEKSANLVILSPQVKMYVDDVKAQAPKDCVVMTTNGKDYVAATRDSKIALDVIGAEIDIKSLK